MKFPNLDYVEHVNSMTDFARAYGITGLTRGTFVDIVLAHELGHHGDGMESDDPTDPNIKPGASERNWQKVVNGCFKSEKDYVYHRPYRYRGCVVGRSSRD